jgi:hypothetical protein
VVHRVLNPQAQLRGGGLGVGGPLANADRKSGAHPREEGGASSLTWISIGRMLSELAGLDQIGRRWQLLVQVKRGEREKL